VNEKNDRISEHTSHKDVTDSEAWGSKGVVAGASGAARVCTDGILVGDLCGVLRVWLTIAWKRRSTLATSGRLPGPRLQHSSVSFQTAGTSPRCSQPGGFDGRPPFDTVTTTSTLTSSGNGTFPVNASTITIARE